MLLQASSLARTEAPGSLHQLDLRSPFIPLQNHYYHHGTRYDSTFPPRFYFANNPAAAQFEAAQPPNDAISALVFAPGASKRLLVSSWDKNVYLYEVVNGSEEANLVGTFEHRAPVLDVCFGASPDEAYTAGMDRQVKRSVPPPPRAYTQGTKR